MKVAPFKVIPFSLARIKSALAPNISMSPLILDTLFPVTSFKITLALLVKLEFLVTCPPICEVPFSILLLNIRPFPVPTLRSINLLWEIPLEFGLTILTTSVLLAEVFKLGPPWSGLTKLFSLFLVLKSLACSSSQAIPPVIRKATIRLKVIFCFFFKNLLSSFSFCLISYIKPSHKYFVWEIIY